MSTHHIRIFSSLLIAFIIVNIYSNFAGISEVVANFRLPKFDVGKLFTLNFDNDKTIERSNNSSPDLIGEFKDPNDFGVDFDLISPIPTLPAVVLTKAGPTIYNDLKPFITPTKGQSRLTPTKYVTKIPTKIPKPTVTKYIKPTKIPPPPPITSDIRPGTTLSEIFQEVGKRACFPPALLRAIQEKETGAWWSFNSPSSKVKIYNTYGWWISGTGNPCTGFGYHTQTGIVPQDSVNAGMSCQNSVGASGDIGVMGLLQVSQEEQDRTRKYTLATLPKSIDRRVIFDNVLIFAIATNNRIGMTPKSCTDWPDDVILTAAETHIGRGSCAAQNYCNDVLKLYKQYR